MVRMRVRQWDVVMRWQSGCRAGQFRMAYSVGSRWQLLHQMATAIAMSSGVLERHDTVDPMLNM